ncbi:MAG: hypothetical protein ACYCRE_05790 [Acidobacteriaceae bacterium]
MTLPLAQRLARAAQAPVAAKVTTAPAVVPDQMAALMQYLRANGAAH